MDKESPLSRVPESNISKLSLPGFLFCLLPSRSKSSMIKDYFQIEVFPSSFCKEEKIRRKEAPVMSSRLERQIFLYPLKATNSIVKII